MVADLAAAAALVALDAGDAARLQRPGSPDRARAPPRRGARRRRGRARASAELGVMLPYTPLHHLLLADAGVPLVMTSGNVSDEPIAYRDDDALERLAGIADRVPRPRPADPHADRRQRGARRRSSCAARAGACRPRSRCRCPPRARCSACGGELKSTFCLAKDRRAWVGHHIGDLRNWETLASYREGVAHFERLFAVAPAVVAHDLHPDYLSTAYALERDARRARRGPAPSRAPRRVPGRARRDGPGRRRDLRRRRATGPTGRCGAASCSPAACDGCVRAGHLWPVRLPGGDAAAREPWRMACAWLAAAGAEPPGADAAAGRRRALGRGRRAGAHRYRCARDDERRAAVRRGRRALRAARHRHLRGPGGGRAGGRCARARSAAPTRCR